MKLCFPSEGKKIGTTRLFIGVMTWVQPFDILLKYKGQAGAVGGVAVDKKETGLTTTCVANPFVSQMWVEIVTYFKSKFAPI